jgi:hypothetical protein
MPPKGPFPREYKIISTQHLRERSALREIPFATVEDIIRTGSECPLPGRGRNGGVRVRFSKKVATLSTVAIAEIIGNDCYLITTYDEE